MEKADGCFLFEFEFRRHALARVDQEGDGEWQIGFTREVLDFLLLLILIDRKIVTREVGDECTCVLVPDRTKNVDEVDVDPVGFVRKTRRNRFCYRLGWLAGLLLAGKSLRQGAQNKYRQECPGMA